MLSINSTDLDAYGPVRINTALDLLVTLTEEMASVMQHMSPQKCREVWEENPTTRSLRRKFDRLQLSIRYMNPQS